MTGMVEQYVYTDLPYDRKEICRYAGCPEERFLPFLNESLNELGKFPMRLCSMECGITVEGETVVFSFGASVCSSDLCRALRGCDRAVLFAATAGSEIDRLTVRYSRLSPARAVTLQAIGAERIESLCDAFCADLKQRYALEKCGVRPRFSPGYGDLPLEFQKDIFRVLECSKRIGLTLNDSLLMSPSKSVTAIVGVERSMETE